MLFLTLTQGQIFLTFLYFGILIGVVFKVCNLFLKKIKTEQNLQDKLSFFVKQKKKKQKPNIKKFFYHTMLCTLVVFLCLVFGILCYFYNFGQIRFFCVAGYCLGMFLLFVLWKFVKTLVLRHKIKHILTKN